MKRAIEIYDRETKEVVEVIDVTEADETQVLAGLRQQMDIRAYGTRIVEKNNG